jgi:hypothetical protein
MRLKPLGTANVTCMYKYCTMYMYIVKFYVIPTSVVKNENKHFVRYNFLLFWRSLIVLNIKDYEWVILGNIWRHDTSTEYIKKSTRKIPGFL